MIPADPLRNLGPASILRGDARALPLADNSVDLIVTSPPYFALRSYQDAGEHYTGQVGSEATPAEFVDALIDCTREMVRVVKPSGSIWVNLGDKYAGAQNQRSRRTTQPVHGNGIDFGFARAEGWDSTVPQDVDPGVRGKSLVGVPWRYALRCIDDLGLILRAEIIWSKPNGLPESVTDRVRRSHEQWFHFVLEPRYYSAVDEIREPHRSEPGREGRGALGGQKSLRPVDPNSGAYSPLGALPGSVWTIPTEPLRVPDHLGIDHFAAFPSEWPKRIIRGWSPAGVCTACGEGRRPVTDYDSEPDYRYVEDQRISKAVTVEWCSRFADWCEASGITRRDLDRVAGTSDMGGWWASRLPHRCGVPTPEQYESLAAEWPDLPPHPGDALWENYTRRVAWSYGIKDPQTTGRHRHTTEPIKGLRRAITGYACGCPEPAADTTPALILDPFGGTGTVAMVARALGRHGIHADLSADYNRLAHWRITDLDQLAHVQGHQRTKRQPDDQPTLLDALDTEDIA